MSGSGGGAVFGDWGTTRLRLFRMEGGAVVRRIDGPGVGGLAAGGAADALRAALAALGGADRVVLCGMAGARGALVEAPYAACPADVRTWAAVAVRGTFDGAALAIAAGLRCVNLTGAPDVMRGEETQVFGALSAAPGLARGRHVVVHPGTHAKWIVLADGVVERFHTFPTGELFALLRDRSTLLRAGAGPGDTGDGFEQGLARAGLLGGLFETRAAQLLDGRSAGWATAFLSGLLIGEEVRAARALLGAPGRVTLIGDPTLAELYARALEPGGITIDRMDGDACVLAGLGQLSAMVE